MYVLADTILSSVRIHIDFDVLGVQRRAEGYDDCKNLKFVSATGKQHDAVRTTGKNLKIIDIYSQSTCVFEKQAKSYRTKDGTR